MRVTKPNMRSIYCMILMLTLMLFNTGCKDDDSNNPSSPPEIEIDSPTANSVYIIDWGGAWPEEERMLIKATARSEAGLALVRIRVLDSQGRLEFQDDFFPQGAERHEFVLEEQFYTDDEGEYELIITMLDLEEQRVDSEPVPFRFEL